MYIHLKRGEFDDDLKWPFRGDIEVRLIDQDKKRHYSLTIQFTDDMADDIAGRVTEGNRAKSGWGFGEFISHNDLQPNYLIILSHSTFQKCAYIHTYIHHNIS